MTLNDFRQSLTAADPPAGLTLALAGLWWDAKGDWKRAHESAQKDEGPEGSWVHAYLHRKEGQTQPTGAVGQPSLFAESQSRDLVGNAVEGRFFVSRFGKSHSVVLPFVFPFGFAACKIARA
jgi:hypothetical protein